MVADICLMKRDAYLAETSGGSSATCSCCLCLSLLFEQRGGGVEYADEISHPGCLHLVFAPRLVGGAQGAAARRPDGWSG